MAYNNKFMKAKAAGSGTTPSIFTYATTDTLTEIQSQNYFEEAAAFLSLGDFIYISYDASTSLYVVSNKQLISGGTNTLNIQTLALFVGDTRATDTAGQTVKGLSLCIQGAAGLFTTYSYRNNTDVQTTILTAGYFSELGEVLDVGDIIYVVANDGGMLVTVLTTGTAVTVEEVVLV